MKVSETDVDHVAALANLALRGDERVRIARDLSSILDYMDRLNDVDTGSVEPMVQLAEARDGDGATREDILEGLRKSLKHDVALADAAETDRRFFIVPKVIER
jgi:aspartyl-tRNA(Asn)/glutamyl-tRNA(Gln) amidotransferase subunit C